jgi:hypothetical protein
MLDNDFLRSLGIKDELLPANEPDGNTINQKESIFNLPLVGEFLAPPEIWDLGDEELKRFIMDKYSQDDPYKCITPQGQIIAIYPHSCESQYGMEFTVDDILYIKNW